MKNRPVIRSNIFPSPTSIDIFVSAKPEQLGKLKASAKCQLITSSVTEVRATPHSHLHLLARHEPSGRKLARLLWIPVRDGRRRLEAGERFAACFFQVRYLNPNFSPGSFIGCRLQRETARVLQLQAYSTDLLQRTVAPPSASPKN